MAAEGEPCRACALTRTRPADDDATGLARFAEAEAAKRRLVFELAELGLPTDGGLTFDMLSSTDEPVTTGHADGVVTIDLAEVDDAHREAMRAQMAEPYRTVLGHLRHEIGHYYQPIVVADWDACRALFGDERDDYAAAMQRHYERGAPADWPGRFVSAYATMHPWEDWAETFAHYLHIADTLQTALAYGVRVDGTARAGEARGRRRRRVRVADRRLAAADVRAERAQPQHGRRGPVPVRADAAGDREARVRAPGCSWLFQALSRKWRYNRAMASKKRSYGDACGIARALDTIGERWALMVVRELLLGPKRFTDLRTGLPHVSPDVLAQRLKDLEVSGVLVKRKLPPPAASQVYELTPRGRALEPVLVALGRWGGVEAPPPTPEMGISIDAQLLSLRTLFDPERAGDLELTVAMELDGQEFFATVAGAALVAERGEAVSPDVSIIGSHASLIELIRGYRGVDEMIADGDLTPGGRPSGLRALHRAVPAARSSSRARSRWLAVIAAARSNSARASSARPSLSSRSPRTLGSRW